VSEAGLVVNMSPTCPRLRRRVRYLRAIRRAIRPSIVGWRIVVRGIALLFEAGVHRPELGAKGVQLLSLFEHDLAEVGHLAFQMRVAGFQLDEARFDGHGLEGIAERASAPEHEREVVGEDGHDLFREGARVRLIPDAATWIAHDEARNETSHASNGGVAASGRSTLERSRRSATISATRSFPVGSMSLTGRASAKASAGSFRTPRFWCSLRPGVPSAKTAASRGPVPCTR